MAFGSATLPVRTKTKTIAKTKVQVKTKTPIASTSKGRTLSEASSQSQSQPKRRESIPDPLSSTEDDDPDFGRAAREQARNSGDELREKEARKRQRAEEKAKRDYARKHGLDYKPPPKPKPSRKRTLPKEEPMRAVRRPSPRSRKPVVEQSSSDSDGEGRRIMRPSFNPDDKRREIAERTGLKLNAKDPKGKGKAKAITYSSDDSPPAEETEDEGYLKGPKAKSKHKCSTKGAEGEAEEIEKHLLRRWVNKKDPERMTAYRKKMEEMHNPLVQLLNVEITVVDSDGEELSHDSDDGERRLRSDSDDDDDMSTPSPRPRKRPHLYDKLPPRITDSSEEDIKPVIKAKPDVEPVLRALPSLTLSDDEPEPDTEEDESPSLQIGRFSSPADVKPVIPPTSPEDLKPVIPPSLPIAPPIAAPATDVKMRSIDSDSEEEPTTDEESPPARPMEVDVKLVIATPSSNDDQSQSEPDTEDDEIEVQEADGLTRDLQAKARRDLAKKVAAEREKAKKENDERIRRELREEQKRREEINRDVEQMDEDEEELSISAATLRAASQAIPREGILVTKGRPKFRMFTQEQVDTGPLRLAKGFEVPATINRFLRPYQRQGVEFLFHQFKNGLGGLLGDDMGLGKTIQVISFLSAVMHKTGRKHDAGRRARKISELPEDEELPAPSDHGLTCLILCPASVVHNWAREFKTWSYIDVVVYGGKDKKDELKKFFLGNKDVVIAGLDIARKDIDDLKKQDFSIVIVDEVHKLKNPDTALTKAMHHFPTELRYGLTGTAVQNRLEELWCILDWACPGKVGNKKQWNDLVATPLKFLQKANASTRELALGRTRAVALVSNLLPKFWLRRTKESVKLQLPRKIDNVVLCPLTKTQKAVYQNIMQLEEVKLLLTADDPCPCGARDPDGFPYKRGQCCDPEWAKLIFQYMDLFRKISNHLALIYSDREDKARNPKKYEQDLAWVQAAFPDDWHRRKIAGAENDYDAELCGKWTILCELLVEWKSRGDKVLLFSNSLKVLDLLEKLLDTKEFRAVRLDGSVDNEDRMRLVDAFNDPDGEIDVFLISTKAGGVGLNLTAANRVIIFDPNWNPSHDLQAMDRAYRFGQTREVQIYRLIGAGTIEELIFNRQQAKRALANIAYDANAERRLFTGVEKEKGFEGELYGVKNIFKYTEGWSLTEKAIKGCGLVELDTDDVEVASDDEDAPRFKEVNGEEIVKDLFDIGKDDVKKIDDKAAQKKAEQEVMKRILGGAVVVNSDATLGNSKAEEALARQAILAQQASRGQTGKAHAPKLPVVDAKATKVDGWDPLQSRRGSKRKASTGSDVKVKVESRPTIKRETGPSTIKPAAVEDRKPVIKQEPRAGSLIDSMPFFTQLKDRCALPSDLSRADFFAGAKSTSSPLLFVTFARKLSQLPERDQEKELLKLGKEYRAMHCSAL